MAESDNKISFLLDLDVAEFTEKGLAAKGVIEKLGSEESLTGLVEGLTRAAPVLAALGVAAFAFKKAIDLTLEGEEINRVNNQFELLAKQAGISATELKEGLEKSAKGLIDTDDLLKIANASLVKLGGSAEKLPEVMTIAMKATQVYGGNAKENFETITNAIANGNTRMLKHYGIIIDAAKAERDFAAANGVTAEELNETGKQQAILNAFLAKGNEAFKNVNVNTESARSTLEKLKVTFHEIGQTFTLVFEKTIGPGMRSFLGVVEKMAHKLNLHVKAALGDAAEASAAKAELAGKKVDDLSKHEEAATHKSLENIKKVSQASIVDQEKQKKQQQEFRKELERIDKEYFTEQQKNVKTLADVDVLVKRQTLLAEQQHKSNLEKIRTSLTLNTNQKKQLEVLENKRFQTQMAHDEDEQIKLRMKLLDNYVSHSKTVFDGIEKSFRANTIKMQKEQADFGKRGNEMWNSLSTNATSAFTNMGAEMAKGKDVASATADAMKGFFLGFLADRAMAEGSLMLLSGIWPPNPVAIGGGIALLALGGALKAAAGAGAAPSTAAASPSTAAAASGAAAPTVPVSGSSETQPTATPQMESQTGPQRQVSVNIQGNYLETDSSRRMLMNLMRQESDATGFNYSQIGA